MRELGLAEENNVTNLRSFIAYRGAIVVKEIRAIAKFFVGIRQLAGEVKLNCGCPRQIMILIPFTTNL